MRSRLRRHCTPSLLIACAALFVALGGTGYAITTLPARSVGTAQLQKDAVTSLKIKDGSVQRRDLAPGVATAGIAGATGARGPAGPVGATGPAGPQGPAGILWATVPGGFDPIAYPGAGCSTACLFIRAVTVTTPAAGKLMVIAGATFQYRCDATSPKACSPIVSLYVDGQPMRGGTTLVDQTLAGGTSAQHAVTVSGVSAAALPAGTHQIELVGNGPGTVMNTLFVPGSNIAALLVNG